MCKSSHKLLNFAKLCVLPKILPPTCQFFYTDISVYIYYFHSVVKSYNWHFQLTIKCSIFHPLYSYSCIFSFHSVLTLGENIVVYNENAVSFDFWWKYMFRCFHCTLPLDQHPGRGRHHGWHCWPAAFYHFLLASCCFFVFWLAIFSDQQLLEKRKRKVGKWQMANESVCTEKWK